MKKILFIAIAAIAFTTASQAQDSTMSKGKMHNDQGDKMHRGGDRMKDLNLTPDQQEKMKKLREDNRTKMEAIKNNTSLSDDQKQEQMKKLRMDQRKNMEGLLTDEQKAKMKDARKQEMMHRRNMKDGGDSTMRK